MLFKQRELYGRGTLKRPNNIAKTTNLYSAFIAIDIIIHKPLISKSLSINTTPHFNIILKITLIRTIKQGSSARTIGINTRHSPINTTINKRKLTALLSLRRNSRPTPSSLF